MSVELSILIAHVPSMRMSLLSRLLYVLEPQIKGDRYTEVVIHRSETKPMGQKFTELYQAAEGRLSVQVDDDDLVSNDFVMQVLAHSVGHDFVGYQVMVTEFGNLTNKVVYEIDPRRTELTPYDPRVLLRHVTPKAPLLTSRARSVPFGSSFGADFTWTQDLVKGGYPENPVFIPQTLYWYDCWPGASLGTSPDEWTEQREVQIRDYDRHLFRWIE